MNDAHRVEAEVIQGIDQAAIADDAVRPVAEFSIEIEDPRRHWPAQERKQPSSALATKATNSVSGPVENGGR